MPVAGINYSAKSQRLFPQQSQSSVISPLAFNSNQATYISDNQDNESDTGNLWNDFWSNFDWSDSLTSLVSLLGAGVGATYSYKTLVQSSGLSKVIDATVVGEFYRNRRDEVVESINRNIKGDSIKLTKQEVQSLYNALTKGNVAQIQIELDKCIQTINSRSGKELISKIDFRALLEQQKHILVARGDTKQAEELAGRIKNNKPIYEGSLEHFQNFGKTFGIDIEKHVREKLPYDKASLNKLTTRMIDHGVGRLSAFLGIYFILSSILGKISEQKAHKKDDVHNKDKKDDHKLPKHSIADFIEEIILVILGGWLGSSVAGKLKLPIIGKRLAIGLGALGGFGLAEIFSNTLRFVYRKAKAMLPEDKRDSPFYKTLLDLALGSFVIWIFYIKAVLVKLKKFTGAINSKGLRPLANSVVWGLMWPQNYLIDLAAEMTNAPVNKHVLDLNNTKTMGMKFGNPADIAIKSGQNPYERLNQAMEANKERIKIIEERSPIIGKFLRMGNSVLNLFSGFPLLQQQAKSNNGIPKLGPEYGARAIGDVGIKAANKVLILAGGSLLAFPLVYLFNWVKAQFPTVKDNNPQTV
ncbi:MAG: hypothetical protein QNJ31_03750 [Candidatus Caenarcaniphilales bacterium]|nr:hypothetical protein [Candidatus Caenarcaniphilales bacterium]